MWNFCENGQFPQSFRPIARNSVETVRFQKNSTPGNSEKFDISRLLHNKLELFCNFIEIALRHERSHVNLLHIFRTIFYKDTYGGLLVFMKKLVILLTFLQFTYILLTLPKKMIIKMWEKVRIADFLFPKRLKLFLPHSDWIPREAPTPQNGQIISNNSLAPYCGSKKRFLELTETLRNGSHVLWLQ